MLAGLFQELSTGNVGNGTSNNTLVYIDTKGNTYDREVNAAYNNITYDHQGGSLTFPTFKFPTFGKTSATFSETPRFVERVLSFLGQH